MQPRVEVIGEICILRWYVRATVAHVHIATDALLEARRAHRRSLVLIGIIPPGITLPDNTTRLEIMRLAAMIGRLYETLYVALPGDGTANILMRGGLGIVSMLVGRPYTVVRSVDESVALASRRVGVDSKSVRAEARSRGLLDGL